MTTGNLHPDAIPDTTVVKQPKLTSDDFRAQYGDKTKDGAKSGLLHSLINQ